MYETLAHFYKGESGGKGGRRELGGCCGVVYGNSVGGWRVAGVYGVMGGCKNLESFLEEIQAINEGKLTETDLYWYASKYQ